MSADETKTKSPASWVPSLYFAEGLPFVVTMLVSVQMYKSLGLSDGEIAAFTSLVAWPWSLKPLWSPFMEMFKTKKYFVVATQFFGGLFFVGLALSLSSDFFVRYSLAFFVLIAFTSATHDIAADGLYIESLSSELQAQYVGWQGFFWTAAKVLAMGPVLWIAYMLEKGAGVKPAWMSIMGLFGGLLVVLSLYNSRALPTGKRAEGVKSVKAGLREFWHVAVTFFKKKYVFWGMAFVVFYRLAEGQAQKIFPLFLRAERVKGGLGLTTGDVGVVYGFFGIGAFMAGSIFGGYFSAKSLRRALLPLCAIFNLPYLMYLFLAWVQPQSLVVTGAAIVVEMFGYGFGFVGVTLFMMQQIATGPYKMAHYAFATSLMNLGLILPGLWSGYLSDAVGYKYFFVWVMVSTVGSFIITSLVPFKNEQEVAAENEAPQLAPV
jgi:PAT family beta-lactamase induction signal transducer AmpG